MNAKSAKIPVKVFYFSVLLGIRVVVNGWLE
jgi:hypothetical protein